MEVLLIRTAPGIGHEILAHSRRTPALCFFHGDGVEHALDPVASKAWAEAVADAGLDLMVCETALARRTKETLKPPWKKASLAQFWAAITPSPLGGEGRGEGWSGADSPSPPTPLPPAGEGSFKVLAQVKRLGDDRFNREILELCLAGAALEVDLAVCFSDAGLELLRGPVAVPWRQFPDFELAPLYYVADREITLDVPAKRLDRATAERMAEQAGRVIDV